MRHFKNLFFSSRQFRNGVIICAFYALMATVLIHITPEQLVSDYSNRYLPPSFSHLMGTDFAGRDTFAMIVHGSRDVLSIGFFAGVFSVFIGVAVGSFAGFIGGKVDAVLMRITDVVLTIPQFPIMMIMAALFNVNNPILIGGILALWSWAFLARTVRAQILSLKNREFVLASRMLNLPNHVIVFKELVPNMYSYLSINFIRNFRAAITASIGLIFLGLMPYTQTNWGMMLDLAFQKTGAIYIPEAIWYVLSPMVTIVLFQYGMLCLAHGLEELFNPRLRDR